MQPALRWTYKSAHQVHKVDRMQWIPADAGMTV